MAYTYNPDTGSYEWENDSNAGEAAAQEAAAQDTATRGDAPWWSSIDTGSSAVNEAISMAFGGGGGKPGESNMANSAAYTDYSGAPTAPDITPTAETKKSDKGFFDRMIDKASDGATKAWEKDPLKVIEFLGSTVGGAYLADQKRKEAEANRTSRIAEQNNAAAIKQAENDAYNASFSGVRKRAPVVNKPLTRMDGSRVWGANGKMNRG